MVGVDVVVERRHVELTVSPTSMASSVDSKRNCGIARPPTDWIDSSTVWSGSTGGVSSAEVVA